MIENYNLVGQLAIANRPPKSPISLTVTSFKPTLTITASINNAPKKAKNLLRIAEIREIPIRISKAPFKNINSVGCTLTIDRNFKIHWGTQAVIQ